MDYQYQNNFQGIQSLIDLAISGHYPLFPSTWLEKFNFKNHSTITKSEKEKAQKIMNRLAQHRSLDRKRTILYSLSETERNIFLKVFFNTIEDKILTKHKELH